MNHRTHRSINHTQYDLQMMTAFALMTAATILITCWLLRSVDVQSVLDYADGLLDLVLGDIAPETATGAMSELKQQIFTGAFVLGAVIVAAGYVTDLPGRMGFSAETSEQTMECEGLVESLQSLFRDGPLSRPPAAKPLNR